MKIFCWINSRFSFGVVVMAMDEDGRHLASHISSSTMWARHDIGLGSTWKHELYRAAHPDGYVLEWIEEADAADHPGLSAAYELNQRAREVAS